MSCGVAVLSFEAHANYRTWSYPINLHVCIGLKIKTFDKKWFNINTIFGVL